MLNNLWKKENGMLGSIIMVLKTSIRCAAFFLCISLSWSADFVPGRILVKPVDSADENQVQASIRGQGAQEVGRIHQINVRILKVPEKAEARVIAALSKNPNFEFAEPDYIATANLTPNDPYYPAYQWHLPAISAPTAWDTITGSPTIILAMIDSGVQLDHPDLAGRILSGYDFANNDADPSDDNGHGTSTAGTAAATGNNGIGMAGLTWGSLILPVKVLGATGSGSYSAISSGINYSADRGARVINMSLGGTLSSSTLQSSVNYAWNKGSVLIAAAGNNGTSQTVYPAACSNVVAVSAINSANTITSWSSYGSFVDLCAPGDNIGTLATGSGYAISSGTSFSSPIVAGVACLALSANPALKNFQVVSVLNSNADDLGTAGLDPYYGYGRVNAARVVAAAPLVDTTSPTTAVTNPLNNASIASLKSVNVSVASSDDRAVTKAELYINGRLTASATTGNFSYTWNTSTLKTGTYQLQSKAYDAAGNTAVSSVVSVKR